MKRRERTIAVFERSAELLGLDIREPEAFGQPHLVGTIDGFACSVSGRSGGMLGNAYRVRFLVVVPPGLAEVLPRRFRAEPWRWWHGVRNRWTGDPPDDPIVGVYGRDVGAFLTEERRAALREAVSLPGFAASDGLLAAERAGHPETPTDITEPIEGLVRLAHVLVGE